jgi:nitrate reductase cytochrome c-type subunit
MACHNLPDMWGKKRDKGVATPIPQSHYTDLRKAPGKVGDKVVGARYNCNQCHVPQMNASPLVGNTFSAGRKR